MTRSRLADWGFNAAAKWNNPLVLEKTPYIWDQGIAILDPYHPDFAASAEKQIQRMCQQRKDDPFLIAYQLANESGWSRRTIAAHLRNVSGSHHAKRALLERLAASADGKAGAGFGPADTSIETLMTTRLDYRKVPSAELDAFILEASRRYHATLAGLVRKYDPDHLFLGASHCSNQELHWIRGSAEYVDVVALHGYDLNSAWILNYAAPVLRAMGKPFAHLEFSFTTTERGLLPFGDRKSLVASHRERGRAFQFATERMASDPLCVGTAYFFLYDQPLTGRAQDKEAYSFGLIDVADRPYQDMILGVKAANARLFGIHAGRLEPTPVEPILVAQKGSRERMPFSRHGFHGFDAANPHLFFGQRDRPHLYFPDGYRHTLPRRPIPLGTVDAGRPDGFAALEFRVFLWDEASPMDPEKWFRLEESPDDVVYRPVTSEVTVLRGGKFTEYGMVPKKLSPGTRYVRIAFTLHDAEKPWISSLSDIRVERRR